MRCQSQLCFGKFFIFIEIMIKRSIFVCFLIALWIYGIQLEAILFGAFVTLVVTYIFLPLIYHFTPWIQRHIIFLTFVNYPWRIKFEAPDEMGLPGTRNFYLKTDDRVQVGIWHILPKSLVPMVPQENADVWYEKQLSDGKPVVLYMHGNTACRASPHRVELYCVLRNMEYHIVSFDYRGYADSTPVTPNEDGVVHDAKAVYHYLQEKTGKSALYVWGHSLGTGVSSHAVRDLCLAGDHPVALVLESPFNNIRDEIEYHPIASLWRKMPMFDWLFLDPLANSGISFRSDEHIKHIDIPVLILHAKDDFVVPYKLGEKLFDKSKEVRDTKYAAIQFVGFERHHGYAHKFICRAPELPQVVRKFFEEAKEGNVSERTVSIY